MTNKNFRASLIKESEPCDRDSVIYICELAPRVKYNPALVQAIKWANELDKKLIVISTIEDLEIPAYHIKFHLEALKELREELSERKIKFVLKKGKFSNLVRVVCDRAAGVVIEKAYLDEHKSWRKDLRKKFEGPLYEVETSLVVPPEDVSSKREYAARTFRPKIMDSYQKNLEIIRTPNVDKSSLRASFDSDIDLTKTVSNILDDLVQLLSKVLLNLYKF